MAKKRGTCDAVTVSNIWSPLKRFLYLPIQTTRFIRFSQLFASTLKVIKFTCTNLWEGFVFY